MTFNSDKSQKMGSVSIEIDAGMTSKRLSNAVTISFPKSTDISAPDFEFYDYDCMKKILLMVVQFWKPERGLIFLHDFSKLLTERGLPKVGWFTYVSDPRAIALRNDPMFKDFIIEKVEPEGVLISLDRHIISPDNFEQVEKAKRLRGKLIEEKLIEV